VRISPCLLAAAGRLQIGSGGQPTGTSSTATDRSPGDGAGSRSRIIILTTFDLDEYAHAALRAGAIGFLLKDAPPADLVSAIRAVATGDAVVAPSTTRRLLATMAQHLPAPGNAPAPPAPPALDALTPREREVLRRVAAGLSNSEIAGQLVLSEATVKTHVGRIPYKLELRDRVQIVCTPTIMASSRSPNER